MKFRRIHFLSAARSDYDLFAPILEHLRPEVEAGVIACSAQVSPFHGYGVRQLEEDGCRIVARLETILASDTWEGRSLSYANLCGALTRLFCCERPDLLFLTGDREEHLAAAVSASFFRIPVAHLHGGDRCVASDIDELMRPAISKLSHYHFTASEGHRERLIRMGEDGGRIWATGAPSLDRLRLTPGIPDDELSKIAGFDVRQRFFLLIQHPSPMLSRGEESGEIDAILGGLTRVGHPVMVSYPNADPGNFAIRERIDRWAAESPLVRPYHNLPRAVFVSLFRRCAAIVGNSSSLVIESTFLGKPGILCGPRQDMRERAGNVMRVGCVAAEVEGAARQVIEGRFGSDCRSAGSVYGDGESAPRIASILKAIDFAPEILIKTMTY